VCVLRSALRPGPNLNVPQLFPGGGERDTSAGGQERNVCGSPDPARMTPSVPSARTVLGSRHLCRPSVPPIYTSSRHVSPPSCREIRGIDVGFELTNCILPNFHPSSCTLHLPIPRESVQSLRATYYLVLPASYRFAIAKQIFLLACERRRRHCICRAC
jgi:hypothetical protein